APTQEPSMHRVLRIALPCLILTGISCAKQGPAPVPAPAPVPTAAPAGGGAAQQAGGGGGQAVAQAPGRGGGAPGAGAPGGAPGGGRGGPQLTPEQRAVRRDSLAALRTATVALLKQQIAGRDSQPAGQVYKNVQLLKDGPAVGLLNTMDVYGRALSVNCTFCHIANQWDSDSLRAKKTTRIMITMLGAINTEQLSKLPAGRSGNTPRIGCTTCHRGNQQPGNALLP
ncbi:MAG: photosynthetic reaction center cytochrome c subunit family protein, partial [Gemmatimonadales bacterium]